MFSKVSALALSCCNALMYADNYVSMHINIWCALSYYPLCALSQPGEPRLSQPWGYTTKRWLCLGAPAHSSALAESKGILLCTSHKAAVAGHDLYNTLYYSKSTKQTAKTIPSNANKGVRSEGCYTFLPRTENCSHSWWQRRKKPKPWVHLLPC